MLRSTLPTPDFTVTCGYIAAPHTHVLPALLGSATVLHFFGYVWLGLCTTCLPAVYGSSAICLPRLHGCQCHHAFFLDYCAHLPRSRRAARWILPVYALDAADVYAYMVLRLVTPPPHSLPAFVPHYTRLPLHGCSCHPHYTLLVRNVAHARYATCLIRLRGYNTPQVPPTGSCRFVHLATFAFSRFAFCTLTALHGCCRGHAPRTARRHPVYLVAHYAHAAVTRRLRTRHIHTLPHTPLRFAARLVRALDCTLQLCYAVTRI